MKSSSVENLSDLLCIVLMPNYMYMSSLGLAAHATTCMCPRYAHIFFKNRITCINAPEYNQYQFLAITPQTIL